MKISIIVPVYNVEAFLPRCLDSLLRQGLEVGEYEVICVNDGSSDGSSKILSDYFERYPNIIHVVTQERQGPGCARNTGVDVARGEYVAFVDSDDYLIDNAYAFLCEHFLKEHPDVVHFDACMMETDGKTIKGNLSELHQISRWIYTKGKTVVDPQAKPEGVLLFDGDGTELYNKRMLTFTWAKIFKRSFLQRNKLKFHQVHIEDEMFNFDVFQHHPHTLVVSSCLYRYEQANPNSLVHTVNKQRVLSQLDDLLFYNIDVMNKYLHENGNDAELSHAAKRNIYFFQQNFFSRIMYVHLTWKEWLRFHRRLKELPAYEYPYGKPKGKMRIVTTLKFLSGKSYMVYLVLRASWLYYERPRRKALIV